MRPQGEGEERAKAALLAVNGEQDATAAFFIRFRWTARDYLSRWDVAKWLGKRRRAALPFIDST